jgi:hypothetical protein
MAVITLLFLFCNITDQKIIKIYPLSLSHFLRALNKEQKNPIKGVADENHSFLLVPDNGN